VKLDASCAVPALHELGVFLGNDVGKFGIGKAVEYAPPQRGSSRAMTSCSGGHAKAGSDLNGKGRWLKSNE
jgi:hypothetical protein